MKNDGVLVSKEWLERVNSALFGNKDGTGAPIGGPRSRFYDIRPVVLSGEWALGDDGIYWAYAYFLDQSGRPTNFGAAVYAPTATDSPGGVSGTTRFTVVWRGRWEMLSLITQNDEIKPARLVKDWTRPEPTYVWQAQAVFVVATTDKNGNIYYKSDMSYVFDVYCPCEYGKPEGIAYYWRFWAKWNSELERWESLQQPVEKQPYVGGAAISVGVYDPELGGRRIDNDGVREARIPGVDYSDTKTLWFNANCFRWISSTLDIVGKKELVINTHYETVVTAIKDGVPETKQIPVIGAKS